MPSRSTGPFPFSAIVGQEQLKLALLLNAVDPRVGGVLIRGEKGTAKSTAVRALVAVMPSLSVVEGCRFSCNPGDPPSWCDECRARRVEGPLPKTTRPPALVELPVSATEDRLVGTLDLEYVLKHGERRFEPGLLARANRSILYVDEVNLLDDHLVDTLLDAAAMGVNTVEREGVSFRHPARFVLVGTMNPEEGELRPQLLDRFGLCVDVVGERDPTSRVEIVRRRRDFDADPVAFANTWRSAEDDLRSRIKTARGLAERVTVSDELLFAIANLALTVGVDGHRADTAMARAAAAHAALHRRSEATSGDVRAVAPLVLAHRTKRTLFDEPRLDASAMAALISSVLGSEGADEAQEAVSAPSSEVGDGQIAIWESSNSEAAPDVGAPAEVSLDVTVDGIRRSTGGKTHRSISADTRGRQIQSRHMGAETGDLALGPTVRQAAAHQKARQSDDDLAIVVQRQDLHEKVRARKVGATIVFCVDASSSMGASERMSAARAAVLDLLVDAYTRRDRVAVVAFRGQGASVILAPTSSVQLAQMRLRDLPVGGSTPLAAGILASLEVLDRERRRSPETIPWIVVVSDGRANVGIDGGQGSVDAITAARKIREAGVNAVFVGIGDASGSEAVARELAGAASGDYVRLRDADHTLASAVRSKLARS